MPDAPCPSPAGLTIVGPSQVAAALLSQLQGPEEEPKPLSTFIITVGYSLYHTAEAAGANMQSN